LISENPPFPASNASDNNQTPTNMKKSQYYCACYMLIVKSPGQLEDEEGFEK